MNMRINRIYLTEQENEIDYFPIRKLEHQGQEYRLHYCKAGNGIIRINNNLHQLKTNQCILTYPAERYSVWNNTDSTLSLYSIHFELIDTEYDLYNLVNLTMKKARMFEYKEEFPITTLESLFNQKSDHSQKSAQYYLIALLYNLSPIESYTQPDDMKKQYINRSIEYMRDHLDGNLSLKSLCEHVNITESYLIKLFHIFSGTTPIKLHTQLRIENACKLLLESMLSISEITERLGFSSESHFSRTFKKYTGFSPSQYKRDFITHLGSHEPNDSADILHMFSLMQTIIDSAPDLIFFKDKRGILLGCNNAFCRIMGLTKDQIIGKRDLDIFPEEEARFYIEKDRVILQTRQPHRNEEWMTYPDGQRRKFEVYKGPLFDADDNLIGIVGISRDITKRG